jgi:hypothetical protein
MFTASLQAPNRLALKGDGGSLRLFVFLRVGFPERRHFAFYENAVNEVRNLLKRRTPHFHPPGRAAGS